jgi:4-hydroxyproline epimerase
MTLPERIRVVDSHTAGEPTRVVVEGGPDLGSGSLPDRARIFAERFDRFRTAVVLEPRGSDVLVGALLCPPADSTCAAGVIFFNNAGLLGMCGHGMIGVAVTLAHLGRISQGEHRIDTPVGVVRVTLETANRVSIDNVPSYRSRKAVTVDVPGVGPVTGDVAWGGYWFFLIGEHGEDLTLSNVERLTDRTWKIRQALTAQGIRGDDGHEIDHIELFGPPTLPGADSRNFVLCPGKAYDRSPCGTGTSAKVACLAAEGKLAEGQVWTQESLIGSLFDACYRRLEGGQIAPRITGAAYVTAESTLLFHRDDPYAAGIVPESL